MQSVLKRLPILAVVLVMMVAAVAVSLLVFAQENNAGSGLRVSPTRTEVSLVPGDSRDITQTIRNVTQNAIIAEPVLNDFESDGVSGNPALIDDPSNVSAYSLREFLELPKPFELQPNEEREVTITLSVPDDSSPGAYFGSVIYRATPLGSSGDGQVALIASVGSLILLEVPGDITEKIQINDISAYLNENKGSLFTKKPDQIGVEIENLGNSFSQPFGKVAVKDWRGNEIFLYELNDSSPRGIVLPSSTRLFINELFNVEVRTVNGEEVVDRTSPVKWPGRYSIVGNISHGSTGEIFTVESSFWYIPVWMITIIATIVVGLIAGAVIMYRKYISKSTKRRK